LDWFFIHGKPPLSATRARAWAIARRQCRESEGESPAKCCIGGAVALNLQIIRDQLQQTRAQLNRERAGGQAQLAELGI
jgi:hypothetical protein